jgi:hypothetical protein
LGRIGMCLWCSWKDLDEQDWMEFIWQELDWRMLEILIFKVVSAAENSKNSKRQCFGRKNQLRTW